MPGRAVIAGVPEGFDAMVLGRLAKAADGRALVHVARDDARMAQLAETLRFFHPDVHCLSLPAWDCQPYDRVSPNAAIVSRRMKTLTRLAGADRASAGGLIVLTTINALLQRLPARATLVGASLTAAAGATLALETLVAFLEDNGYTRTGTVMEPGEYAPRGGLVDVFPAGAEAPVRIDFFGDEVESIRAFDPLSQRSAESIGRLAFGPVRELRLDAASIERFRAGYRELFGAMTAEDPLYESISAGRRHPGMEHWLALFHERLDTLFDYLPDAPVTLDPLIDDARDARLAAIADHYAARGDAPRSAAGSADAIYRAVPPDRLYLDGDELERRFSERAVAQLTQFSAPEGGDARVVDMRGKAAYDFTAERAQRDVNLFDAVRVFIAGEQEAGTRVLVACYSAGSRDRLAGVLSDHGVDEAIALDDWEAAQRITTASVGLIVLGLEHGFAAEGLVVLAEQDILGDRLSRPPRRVRRADAFLSAASALDLGDLVVHIDHGIGRYDGLETLTHEGVPHDCVRLVYAGDDRLYLPVENIEVLSRYGTADAPVQLDKLGGAHWQARRAKLKERVREMASALMRVAAERKLRPAEVMTPPEGPYAEFCARFPFTETEDQRRAIEDVIADLASGRPMDRLICGDVGFGKTEVALRAAFITVMSGRQVAIVAPTTLLCRQHHAVFTERFAGLPVRVAQLSRLVPARQAQETRAGITEGGIDIVIGTHALLGKSIRFRDLGLLVVDEEQHFGVAHKERLKKLRSDVHVLTLTATPIPRTLQMALTGVRELSIIATPPVDRLAIRTFIMPYDPVIVREAILREHFRGGQTFYVCPRIEDIDRITERMRELVPEVRVAVAHGRMSPRRIEEVMLAFYDGAYDVLVSTAIIESGLDIPSVNTLLIHRSHMFGLAQLYQLRGRIGRAKVRAYAYLTLPPRGGLTDAATKRLEVIHKLDTLGAGFTLASHDLDIRGAGNLLGAEQSGQIREVGLELYQHMLEDAVRELRAAEEGIAGAAAESWSPQIDLGTAVLIPEDFVADLGVRLGLYRRLASLVTQAEIDAFAAELIDRFGTLPPSVEHLISLMGIKRLCRDAGIGKLDAGEQGAVLSFYRNRFADPGGLVAFIGRQPGDVRLRPDHTLVIKREWAGVEARLGGVRAILSDLAEIAHAAA